MRLRKLRPPLPPEHGARSLLIVGLLTPVSVGLGAGVSWTSTVLVSVLLFWLLTVGAMLFREAVRRHGAAAGHEKRRYAVIGAVEALLVSLAIGGLVVLQGPIWALGVLAVPAVLVELRYRGQGGAGRLRGVAAGVLGLSVIAPAGAHLLGITNPGLLGVLYALFAGYHLLATYRVRLVVTRTRAESEISTGRWLLVPVGAVVAVLGGWSIGLIGPAGPVLFGLSTARTVHLAITSDSPPMKRLGQTEALLSTLFVLGGPWLLP
ncbi:hypothetical protein RH831_04545 [Halodesulfurarchaeum sp. HSR-GB]|uniref:hypothetical protein n=1 Tax=Halodesulfurarchaeum sp. HSR-GB TaxID=3074077 RepID=UPI0028627F65|nr:hypothetical protein [Halodesulfurarchaeum sp. HSR-GB]MDR5656449.1 hypothetical protein [Halodesulfurarchaeum sp. HSR-GB]